MKYGALTWAFAALGLLLAVPAYAADTVYYYSSDIVHSEVVITDASRNVVERTHYAPYGAVLNRDLRDGPGYTGHEEDPETGLVYMQQRYYCPECGRFLSVDPVQADGGGGSFNRYAYAKDNPYKNIDPDGRTCKKVGSSYSCEIDKVASQVNGETVTRNATAADHKTYAAVEKSLTQAVNAAASSGKTENVSVKSGGTTYSFSISGAKIASALAIRAMTVDPHSSSGAMNSPSNRATNINKAGIDPTMGHPGATTAFGDADRTRSMEFLHEGIHWSAAEAKGFGAAEPLLGTEPLSTAHQAPYDAAADDLLGH